jgi:hypothetical protein
MAGCTLPEADYQQFDKKSIAKRIRNRFKIK